MTTSGSSPFSGTNQFTSDSGMLPASFSASNEFDFFEDIHPSGTNIFDFTSGELLDTSLYDEPKSFPPGLGQPEQVSPNRPLHFPSHRGSASSSSSMISGNSTSAKTSQSSTEAMVTDEHFSGWNLENESRHMDGNFVFDTIDPTAMEMSRVFDFDSASSSPSPAMNGLMQESPVVANSMSNAPAAKRIKGHHKTQSQHSITKSMNCLKTSGSREGSPASNIMISQETSPSAILNNSPPPDNITSRLGTMSNQQNSLSWPPDPGPWVNRVASKPPFRRDLKGMPANSLSSYSHQISLASAQRPRLVIQPTPLKSRVETQIPIKLTIHALPPGIKRLHLPTHTISKPKLLAKPGAARSPDMLELYTMLVCTSAMQDPMRLQRAFRRAAVAGHDIPSLKRSDDGGEDDEHKPQNGGEVRICAGCITRERKRASRKKHKKPEEDELWNRYEHQRVIVFNTQEIKDWQAVTPHMVDPTGAGPADLSVPDGTVQVDAPMRIACYCRHHGEKMGFQVIFTIKDYQDNVIAQQISSSIMITDDHKTHLPAASATQNSVLSPPLPVAMDVHHIESFRMSPATSDLQGLPATTPFSLPGNNSQSVPVTTTTSRNMSRQGSPTSPSGLISRKRKASGSVKLPTGLAMTRLETGQPPLVMPPGAHNESAVTSATASPFSPNMGNFPVSTESMMFHGQQASINNIGKQYSASAGPPTPNSNNPEIGVPQGSRNMSIDNVPVSQMFSTPSSAHPSRAPSPSRVRNDIQNVCHSSLSQNIYNAPTAMNSSRAQPMIYKIIPGEGPKSGGVEVTILGSNFTNGGLDVMFGEQRAATTTFWGETSLVCLLPPSHAAGVVPVSIRQPGVAPQLSFNGNQQQPLFRYVDDDEHRLIRTALTVLGNKLGNKMTDVADIARNIIYGPATGGSWGHSPGSNSQTPNTNFNNLEQDLSESVEKGLLRILELIDLDDSPNKAKINLRRASGQTMLHLASSIGLVRFVAGLLSRGANVGVRDKGGFTPLHLAAMNDHQEIVRRLIMRGADPNMRSLSGLTPADVARSSDVLRVLRQIENHSRSRSNGSLHSRANSASSLRSLWDPSSMAPAHREEFILESPSSSEESSDDDDDSSVQSELNIRRPSFPQYAPSREPTGVDAPPATTTAAVAALREQFAAQFQQLQHSMTMHFQNLPHMQMPQMPQMPALPPIPVLPDYHSYLHAAPVMQRISSLVPNIRGQRPEPGDEEPPRDADSKWWDLSRFGVKDSPPPAYNSIFPQRDIDVKQATAAAAAAEAVADEKCTALYDQAASQSQEVPALLEIGHKHSITKEQQEHLQRAHAQRLKTGSSDKMLWFVWIPILIFILGAMLVSVAPSLVFYGTSFVNTSAAFVANPREFAQRLTLNIAGTP